MSSPTTPGRPAGLPPLVIEAGVAVIPNQPLQQREKAPPHRAAAEPRFAQSWLWVMAGLLLVVAAMMWLYPTRPRRLSPAPPINPRLAGVPPEEKTSPFLAPLPHSPVHRALEPTEVSAPKESRSRTDDTGSALSGSSAIPTAAPAPVEISRDTAGPSAASPFQPEAEALTRPRVLDPAEPVELPAAVKSGMLEYHGPPVPKGGEVVFDGLPEARLKFTFDSTSWQPVIRRTADGGKHLILRSLKPGLQTECVVRWDIVP